MFTAGDMLREGAGGDQGLDEGLAQDRLWEDLEFDATDDEDGNNDNNTDGSYGHGHGDDDYRRIDCGGDAVRADVDTTEASEQGQASSMPSSTLELANTTTPLTTALARAEAPVDCAWSGQGTGTSASGIPWQQTLGERSPVTSASTKLERPKVRKAL